MNVRVCPGCNSPNVVVDSLMDRKYRCVNCGFVSTLFPEIIVKKLDEIKNLRVRKVKK